MATLGLSMFKLSSLRYVAKGVDFESRLARFMGCGQCQGCYGPVDYFESHSIGRFVAVLGQQFSSNLDVGIIEGRGDGRRIGVL